MPRRKDRQREANGDWETDVAEENDLGAENRTKPVDADKFGEEKGNDLAKKNPNNVRPRPNGPIDRSQPNHDHGLGPWTEAVTDTVRSLGIAHKAIGNLRDNFSLHINQLAMMEQTRENLEQVEEECRKKDQEIRRQEDTIVTLSGMNSKHKETIELEMGKIETEKRELQLQKAKLEKRVDTQIAEERHKLRSEFEKLVMDQGRSHDKRKTELEDEFNKQRTENNRQVTALEAENRQLSSIVDEQKKKIGFQAKEVEKLAEQCDVLERAKNSIKQEKLILAKELDTMRTEFALNSRSTDDLKQQFEDICTNIEDIAREHFNEIDGKDLESIHEQLVAMDRHFESVPIDHSDDSHKLCTAHAQRVISESICEHIWKPISSDLTLLQPEFSDFLAKIANELEISNEDSRVSNVWVALTIRALQSLPADSVSSRTTEHQEPRRTIDSARAHAVVSKVFTQLSPLSSPTRYEELRSDLLNLADSAIAVWTYAQTGDLKIAISSTLDFAFRKEWRSEKFDSTSPTIDDYDSATISQARPRIFTLFPRIVARGPADLNKGEANPPGSWPENADLASRMIETCIHPGIGLSEHSQLVLRGKEEQNQRNEYISNALANAKKESHSKRRSTVCNEINSIDGSISTPPSPSQQWKSRSSTKVLAK